MASSSLYQQILAARFTTLPPLVAAFHTRQGRHLYTGTTEVFGPQTPIAKLMALVLGTPRQSGHGPIHFELRATPQEERWTRNFVGKTMVSNFRAIDGQLVEQLGPVRLRFELLADSQMLQMKLVALSVLHVPCPNWLMQCIVAEESERDGCFHFNVAAHLPWIGRVVGYQGFLVPVTSVDHAMHGSKEPRALLR